MDAVTYMVDVDYAFDHVLVAGDDNTIVIADTAYYGEQREIVASGLSDITRVTERSFNANNQLSSETVYEATELRKPG